MAAAALEPGARRPALLGLALALTGGIALATVFWTTDILTADTIANWGSSVTAGRSGPAVALAMLLAAGVGASMVVMPCGFPAVFAVPTILEREERTAGRLRALAAFADDKGATPAQIAIAWLLAQGDDIVPIPGAKSRGHLEDNLGALEVELTPGDLARLDELFPPGAAQGTRYAESQMHRVNR